MTLTSATCGSDTDARGADHEKRRPRGLASGPESAPNSAAILRGRCATDSPNLTAVPMCHRLPAR